MSASPSRDSVRSSHAPFVETAAPRSDLDLLQGVIDGDEDALVALFDAHRGRAFGVALRVLRDPCEAEDAVQETFVQIWRRPECYDRARGDVGAWIRVIARSRALDRLRRLRRTPLPARETPRLDSHPEDRLCMEQAIDGLSPHQRDVIHLSFYEGLTQSEIAHRLALPLGTVKGRMRTGLIRLRECLTLP